MTYAVRKCPFCRWGYQPKCGHERCHAFDFAVDENGEHIGDCSRVKGHPGRHVELDADGEVLAEWGGTAGYRREPQP